MPTSHSNTVAPGARRIQRHSNTPAVHTRNVDVRPALGIRATRPDASMGHHPLFGNHPLRLATTPHLARRFDIGHDATTPLPTPNDTCGHCGPRSKVDDRRNRLPLQNRRTEHIETQSFGSIYSRCAGDPAEPLVLYLHGSTPKSKFSTGKMWNNLVSAFAGEMAHLEAQVTAHNRP